MLVVMCLHTRVIQDCYLKNTGQVGLNTRNFQKKRKLTKKYGEVTILSDYVFFHDIFCKAIVILIQIVGEPG